MNRLGKVKIYEYPSGDRPDKTDYRIALGAPKGGDEDWIDLTGVQLGILYSLIDNQVFDIIGEDIK